jgi:hypothetical protein
LLGATNQISLGEVHAPKPKGKHGRRMGEQKKKGQNTGQHGSHLHIS